MKKPNRLKRLTALVLAVLMVCGMFAVSSPAAFAAAASGDSEELSVNLNALSYRKYHFGTKKEKATKSANAQAFLATNPDSEYVISVPVSFDSAIAGKDIMTAEPMQKATDLAAYAELSKGMTAAEKLSMENALYLPSVGSVSFKVNIPEGDAGLYKLRIEYYAVPGSTSAIERVLFIDGEVPFAEARALSLSKQWTYEYEVGEDGKNTYELDKQGNSLRAPIEQVFGWRTYECSDSDGFITEPFEFFFREGDHTISLQAIREGMIIRSISLVADKYVDNYDETVSPSAFESYEDYEAAVKGHKVFYTYEDYKKDFLAGKPNASDKSFVNIQAEVPDLVSDSSVYAANDRSSAITTPSAPDAQRLNTIGKNSYNTVGQWASYNFNVAEDGVYQFVLRYKQTALEGMFVSRSLKLWSSDGKYGLWFEVDAATAQTYGEGYRIDLGGGKFLVSDGTPTNPFEDAKNVRFNYNKDWVVAALGDANQTFDFYFEEGTQYVLSLDVSLGQLADTLSAIESSLTVINQCYLSILQLTGPDPDEYRDYGFARVMPATIIALQDEAKNLEAQVKALEDACGSSGSQTATLSNIARLLEKMGSDEDEIAPNLENLKSYIGTLGTWINTAKQQSLTVDSIHVQSEDVELPEANAGFFYGVWFEIRAFFASFYVDYNSMGVTDEVEFKTSIDVWLAYGRDQSQIWKNLLDNFFTSKTGIAANLKLVAVGTLLPSVLAGQGPDAYIGLASTDVINYAIRGAIINIDDYEGFQESLGYDEYELDETGHYRYFKVTTDAAGNKVRTEVDANDISFNAACMIPISLYGKTYGLPETASLPMMFYRQDILDEIDVPLPETWDDVLAAIPVLQANNMEIGLQYINAINMFLYQYGSTLWKYEGDREYAGAHINLDDSVALDSFNFCCRLYTDYSFPFAFDGPNRFRTGEMPILIADYVTTYNQLVVFATEIKNLWSFTSLPGILDASNKLVNNQSVVTVTATVMLTGCEDEASTWEYMKWQADGEMQGKYGNEMVALVGPAAKYASANIKGIQDLSWTAVEYANLMAQFQNMAAIPNYPGSYIIARYIEFAFLAAYNDNVDPTDAMEQYVPTINQELARKREEFVEEAGIKVLQIGETPESARAEEAAKGQK